MPQTTETHVVASNDRGKKPHARGQSKGDSSTPLSPSPSSVSYSVRRGTKSTTAPILHSSSSSKPAAFQSSAPSAARPQTSIKILICTANLGNAQPDGPSWDAWIPKLGNCAPVIQNAKAVQMDPPPEQRRRPSSSVTSDQSLQQQQQQQRRRRDRQKESQSVSSLSPRKPQPNTDLDQESERRTNACVKGSATASSDRDSDEGIKDSPPLNRKPSMAVYQGWLQTNCGGAPIEESNPDTITIRRENNHSPSASSLTRKSSMVDYQLWLDRQGQQNPPEIGEGCDDIEFPPLESGMNNMNDDNQNVDSNDTGGGGDDGDDNDYDTFLKSMATTQDQEAVVDDYDNFFLGEQSEQPKEDGSYEAWLASQAKIDQSILDGNGENGGDEEHTDNSVEVKTGDGTMCKVEKEIFDCSHELNGNSDGSEDAGCVDTLSRLTSFTELASRGQKVERLISFSELARQRHDDFSFDSNDSHDDNALGSNNNKPTDRAASVCFETNFADQPSFVSGPPLVSADDAGDNGSRGHDKSRNKEKAISKVPRGDSGKSQIPLPAPDHQEFFDIIVIGMQEATFDIEIRGIKEGQASINSKTNRRQPDEVDDDASRSDSCEDDEDEDDEAATPILLESMSSDISEAPSLLNSTTTSSFEEDEEGKQGNKSSQTKQPSKEGRNSLSSSSAILTKASTAAGKKLLGATMKAGKVGLKVGKAGIRAGQKVTKVTMDTAKTVNTLATAKNHTTRPFPSDRVDGKGHDGRDACEDPETLGYPPGWSDTDVLHYHLEKDQLPGYRRALSYQLGQMRLIVYFRPSASTTLDVVTVKHQATGKAGLLANKGGIVAEVAVNKSTRLSFLTAHLEAHEGAKKYAARNSSLMDILMGTKSSATAPFGMTSSKTYYDASSSSHFAFTMGDLNYRTRLAGVEPGSDRHIKMVHSMTKAQDWKILNKFDELAYALRMKECMVGFETPYCDFSPTFKVARKEGFEYNVKRSPSYTDRILYRSGDQLGSRIRPLMYEPVEKFTTSDHKPMRGAFSVQLNEPLKWGAAAPLTDSDDTRKSKNGLQDVDERAFRFFGQEFEKRETMHLVASAIQCFIYPEEYDKLRKVEKADLPNPFVCFVSTPTQAVHLDDGTSKKGLWSKLASFGSKKKNSKEDGRPRNSTNGTGRTFPASVTRLSDRYPCTSIIEETMKPNWLKENLHFTIRTHLSNGVPIDLSGALLHITLMDARGPTVIGSFALNLSELISKSRRPSKRGVVKPKEQITSPRSGPLRMTTRDGTNPGQESGLLSPGGRRNQASSPKAGGVAVQERNKVSSSRTPRAFVTGPSMSLRNLMVEESNVPKDGKNSEMLQKFQIMSLRLDETLIDCGLEVGKIKCTLDVWWANDDSSIGEDD